VVANRAPLRLPGRRRTAFCSSSELYVLGFALQGHSFRGKCNKT
jgi:hypothetical protein